MINIPHPDPVCVIVHCAQKRRNTSLLKLSYPRAVYTVLFPRFSFLTNSPLRFFIYMLYNEQNDKWQSSQSQVSSINLGRQVTSVWLSISLGTNRMPFHHLLRFRGKRHKDHCNGDKWVWECLPQSSLLPGNRHIMIYQNCTCFAFGSLPHNGQFCKTTFLCSIC